MTMREYMEKNGQKIGEYLYGGYQRCDVFAEGGYLHYIPKGRSDEIMSKLDNLPDRDRLVNSTTAVTTTRGPQRITVEEMRDMLDALCHDGLGHLPLSKDKNDVYAGILPPMVIHVADTPEGERYFTTGDVEKGAPQSRGLDVPPPTFVLLR
jgi:hypothetical protein